MPHKPIETRELFTQNCGQERGKIRLFLEIISSFETGLLKEVWQISPKPE